MADDDIVILQSQDGEFKIIVKVAKISITLKNLIDDVGIEKPIPIPNIRGDILDKN